ncbi:hypothetical protein V3C99_008483 [Haemonchus contortus]
MVICAVCERVMRARTARRMSAALNQNVTLLMSLTLAGHMEVERARSSFETATKRNVYVCHRHVVHAAQFWTAEMVRVGSGIRLVEDPNARRPTAYVANGDIPGDTIDELNKIAGVAAVVTCRDVSKFLNDALSCYYATKLWPVTEEKICNGRDSSGKNGGGGKAVSVSERSDPSRPNGSRLLEKNQQAGSSSIPEKNINGCASNGGHVNCITTTVEKTDPTVLSQYFSIKGEMLLQLFNFCPRCGHRLPGARLKAVGKSAVVKFICHQCSMYKMKLWEGQELSLLRGSERAYKGNVKAAVSAINTGLRYEKLERWANQLNLSMFSRKLSSRSKVLY